MDFNFLVELFITNDKRNDCSATNYQQTILNLFELISFHDTENFLEWAQKMDLIRILAKSKSFKTSQAVSICRIISNLIHIGPKVGSNDNNEVLIFATFKASMIEDMTKDNEVF